MSAAYYSLFHALVGASCDLLAGPGEGARALRTILARTYTHSEMQRASRAFAQGANGLPGDLRRALAGTEVSSSLRRLAQRFHLLQDDRHEADYDLTVQWRRSEVLVKISGVDSCLEYLRRERTAPDLRAYLTSILVWNRISNR